MARLKEECGVFGIFNNKDAAALTALGLHALQHRGQESCGILTLNNCSYEDFEKRLLEIYSISKENYFSQMEQNIDYIMKFSKDYSTIDLIRKKIFELGVAQK